VFNAPTVRVNRKAADRIRSGHPWVFRSDLLETNSADTGDVVRVIDFKGHLLGMAHHSTASQIALRMLGRQLQSIDEAWLRTRIRQACEYRKVVVSNSDAYRLIYSEGDLLPGLIVDRYGDHLVAQFLDQGMDKMSTLVAEILESALRPKGILARNDSPVRQKEDLPREVRVLAGDVPARVELRMNGLNYEADLWGGQKTGIFLDQRENYLAARQYGRGRALDCFTATGGFALHLASVCEHVEAVDSSAATLETAKRNATLNKTTNIEWREADVLEYLPGLVAAKRTFEIVVVDPPAFTKSRGAIEGATRGYKEINLRALRLLQQGGILVSCSCSQHMSEAHFLELIASAALDSGKQLRVLERRTQARDHPILLTVPETHYLKCLIFEVI